MRKVGLWICMFLLGVAPGLRAATPQADVELSVADVYGDAHASSSVGDDSVDVELTLDDLDQSPSVNSSDAPAPARDAAIGQGSYKMYQTGSGSEEPCDDLLDEMNSEKYSFYDDYLVLDNKRNSLEMGIEWFDYTYREEGFMKLDGTMAGVYAVYTHRQAEPQEQARTWRELFKGSKYALFDMIRLDTRFSQGDDMHYRSGGTGEMFDQEQWTWESRAVVGYDVAVKQSMILTPYIGLGYRYLMHDNSGRQSSTGAWGYDRESTYWYLPLGFDLEHEIGSGWSMVWNFEYDFFLDGEQRSHLEDVPGYSEELVNNQDEGWGYRGSLMVVRKMKSVDLMAGPFARYWHIKDSDVQCTVDVCGLEPHNRTWEFGIRAGIRF